MMTEPNLIGVRYDPRIHTWNVTNAHGKTLYTSTDRVEALAQAAVWLETFSEMDEALEWARTVA